MAILQLGYMIVNPIRLTLKDDTVVTLNGTNWLWVSQGQEQSSGSGVNKKTWWECDVHLAGDVKITVKGKHDYVVRCLLGLDTGAMPSWWPPKP